MIRILHGKAEDRFADIPDESIQLTVSSPPYSDQRNYADGNDYDFSACVKGLYDKTVDGGIVAWNEGLTCRKNDEQSDPYEHVLGFKAAGFRLLQTLIVKKDGIPFPGLYRFGNQTEFCWILLKGERPRIFNKHELKDRINRQAGKDKNAAQGRKGKNDELARTTKKITIEPVGYRSNCWDIPVGFNKTSSQDASFIHSHPALMAESLADSLIRCYSKPGDTVLDIFSGGGTTAKMAQVNGRDAVGIERSKKYISLSLRRLKKYTDDIEVS
jgi:DNA modification methylase